MLVSARSVSPSLPARGIGRVTLANVIVMSDKFDKVDVLRSAAQEVEEDQANDTTLRRASGHASLQPGLSINWAWSLALD